MLRLVYSCTWCDRCRGTQGSWALWALTFYNPNTVYRYESDDTWRHLLLMMMASRNHGTALTQPAALSAAARGVLLKELNILTIRFLPCDGARAEL